MHVAHQAPARDVALSRHDLDELAALARCDPSEGPAQIVRRRPRRGSRGEGAWGDHAVEPLIAFTAALIYILVTVTAGLPIAHAIAQACGLSKGSPWNYVILFADALLYTFFTVVFSLLLRLVQGRTLLARFGKRTCLVLDVPMVHQCAVAFAQKLFGLSYGLNVRVCGRQSWGSCGPQSVYTASSEARWSRLEFPMEDSKLWSTSSAPRSLPLSN